MCELNNNTKNPISPLTPIFYYMLYIIDFTYIVVQNVCLQLNCSNYNYYNHYKLLFRLLYLVLN